MKPSLCSTVILLTLAGALATHPANLRAQASTSTSTTTSTSTQTQTSNPPPAPQKKVWTNDDVDQLRDQGAGGISVIGSAPAAPAATTDQKTAAKPGTTAAKLPNEKDPEWYRKQLAPLYATLDRINDEMASAQSAIDGDSRGDSGVSMGARAPAGTPQEQVAALQKQAADTQAKIDALLDMARHNDIPPGDLR